MCPKVKTHTSILGCVQYFDSQFEAKQRDKEHPALGKNIRTLVVPLAYVSVASLTNLGRRIPKLGVGSEYFTIIY